MLFYFSFVALHKSSRKIKEKNSLIYLKEFKNSEDDEEEKFAMTGTTTHRWIQGDESCVKNQIFKDGSYIEGSRLSLMTMIREEKLKVQFFKNKIQINY